MATEKTDYQAHLKALLTTKGLQVPTTRIAEASTEIINTLDLMLQERDPRFATEVARRLTNLFGWAGISYIAEKLTTLVRYEGKEKGIKVISFKDAIGMVYAGQPVNKITRPIPERSPHDKLLKNSQVYYKKEDALTGYIRENMEVELLVRFKPGRFEKLFE